MEAGELEQETSALPYHLVHKRGGWRLVLPLVVLAATLRQGHSLELDPTIYGSFYRSTATVVPSDIADTCFGGLDLGSCQPAEDGWQFHFLDSYNAIFKSVYCLECCSNTGTTGDTWNLQCDLPNQVFVTFANRFGYEFRFARNLFFGDTEVVSCPIKRSACTYDDDGALVGTCTNDGTYLAGYTLTLDVLEKVKGTSAWKAIRSCSVETTESDEVPEVFAETIVMQEVYRDPYILPWGYILLFCLTALLFFSWVVRLCRNDVCSVCGYPLVYSQSICVPCQFYGYDEPSKAMQETIRRKEQTWVGLDGAQGGVKERFQTTRLAATKIFVDTLGGGLSPERGTRGRGTGRGTGRGRGRKGRSRGDDHHHHHLGGSAHTHLSFFQQWMDTHKSKKRGREGGAGDEGGGGSVLTLGSSPHGGDSVATLPSGSALTRGAGGGGGGGGGGESRTGSLVSPGTSNTKGKLKDPHRSVVFEDDILTERSEEEGQEQEQGEGDEQLSYEDMCTEEEEEEEGEGRGSLTARGGTTSEGARGDNKASRLFAFASGPRFSQSGGKSSKSSKTSKTSGSSSSSGQTPPSAGPAGGGVMSGGGGGGGGMAVDGRQRTAQLNRPPAEDFED